MSKSAAPRRAGAAVLELSLLSARGRPGPRRAAGAPRPATSASSSIDALRSASRTLEANCDARLSIVLRRLLMREANTALRIELAIKFQIRERAIWPRSPAEVAIAPRSGTLVLVEATGA